MKETYNNHQVFQHTIQEKGKKELTLSSNGKCGDSGEKKLELKEEKRKQKKSWCVDIAAVLVIFLASCTTLVYNVP